MRGTHGRYSILKAGLMVLLFIGIAACKKDGTIGISNPGDNDMAVDVTDTFTVKSSTLLLDSLPTAGKGVLLVGRMNDPELGNVVSNSYFPIVPSNINSSSFPEDARLDSVRLRLTYNGYYYGDTTQNQTISVRQLAEKIVYKPIHGYIDPEEQNVFSGSSTFYNRSAFSFSSQSLGSITFKPKPKSAEHLFIPLPNELGNTLISMVKNNDEKLQSSEEFIEYFKGLALVAPQNTGNAVIGYSDSLTLKVYYTFSGDNGLPQQGELSFIIENNVFQFNQIVSDRNSTLLKNIGLANKSIPASQTDGKTYIQAGIGLVTKLEFPTISYLVGDDRVAINKAELIIESPHGTDKPFDLPSELIVLLANQNNKPVEQYSETNSGTTMNLVKSDDVSNRSYYSYIITDYISNYNKKYNKSSLFISLPIANLQNSVNRLVLGSQANAKAKIKLKITYTKFN